MNSAYNGTTSYSRASLRASGKVGKRFLPVPLIEHPRHLFNAYTALLKQDQEMVQEIRRLFSKSLIFEGGDHDLDCLFAHLLGSVTGAAPQELRRVGALRHLAVALGYRPGELREGSAEVRGFPVVFAVDGSEEAAILASVAGRPTGHDPVEQRIAVAVEADLDHSLGVAARRPLAPDLIAGAGVVVSLAGLYGLVDRLFARVGEHEDLARLCVLGDHGDETSLVVADAGRGVQRTGIPAAPSLSLTSAILHSPQWKMLAAKTALAPT